MDGEGELACTKQREGENESRGHCVHLTSQ